MTCPGCERDNGIEQTDTAPGADVWRCSHCHLRWAVTVANPRPLPAYLADLGTAAEEIGRLRWALHRVIDLADAAPDLTDAQLRQQLLVLAEQTRPRGS